MKTMLKCKFHLSIIAILMAAVIYALNITSAFADFTKPVTYKKNDGYASIIIDWQNNFKYRSVVKGNILYLSFDKEYAKGFSNITTELSGYVQSYYVSKDLKNIKIVMNNKYIVRDYFENKKLFIDIVGAENKILPIKEINVVKEVAKTSKPISLVKVNKTKKPLEENNVSKLVEPVEEVIVLDDITEQVEKVKSDNQEVKSKAIDNIAYGEGVLFATNHENEIANKEPVKKEEITEEKVDVLGSMSFSWDHPTHSAVFRKDGYLWVVFDRKKDFDMEELIAPARSVVTSAVIIPHTKTTIVRIVTKANIYAKVRREKLLWIVDFVSDPTKLAKSIDVQSQYNDFDGFKLHMNVSNAGKVYSIVDPEIGDGLFVVPVADSSYGVPLKYNLPDLELLNSSQGIVVVPKTNRINVLSTSSMVDVYIKDDGLNVTSDSEQIAHMIKYMKNGDVSQPFNLKQWKRGGRENFSNEVATLLSVIKKWDKEKVNIARLELARFYAANGYGAEALGVLSLIKDKDAKMEENAGFHAVRGLANFLMERYDEALKDFTYEKLSDNDEALLWQNIVKLTQNPKSELNSIILSYAGYLKTYPSVIKTKVYMLAAYSALAAGDELTLRNYIREIGSNKSKTNNQSAEYYYLISKYDILSGNYNSAIRNLDKVLEFNSLKFSAYARKDLAMMKYEMAKGKLKSAIAEFERLKYVWREPSYEKLVLNYLVMLYDKDKNYIDALRTLNNIRTVFGASDPDLEASTLNKMKNLYFDLFVEGKADVYSPVKYLGLFEEFRWLIPGGKKGLEVAQSVSDRLVGVDLLDKAAELLSDQIIVSNAVGEDKLRFGARLALVYLLDAQPSLAINALDDTEELDIENPNLYIQRKLIKARALADLGKNDQAISLIKNNKEIDAVVLRSEIYWDAKKWTDAANEIRILIEKPKPNSKVSDVQAQYILDWITALKMSGRSGVIAKIRYKFKPYFIDSKYYTTFNLLTGELRDDNINLKNISTMVDDVTRYGDFIKTYHDKIKKDGLSNAIK